MRGTPERGAHVLVLAALSTLAPLTISLSLPALPEVGAELGVGPEATQGVVTGALAGLAVGQLVLGPLSDRVGRRVPLLMSIAVYAAATVACAVVADVTTLVVLRVVQGAAASAGIVLPLASVRDRFAGARMSRILATLAVVGGVGPVVAPTLGSALLAVTDWRGLFVVTAALSALLLGVCVVAFPETACAPARRRPWLTEVAGQYTVLLRDRRFVLVVLMGGFLRASQFGYMAWAPFVFLDHFGLSRAAFSVLYGMNGVALIVGAQLSARLITRVDPLRMLAVALGAATASAGVLLASGLALTDDVALVAVPLVGFLVVVGMFHPIVPTLALEAHAERAGTGSALTGALYFGLGAALGPVAGQAMSSPVGALGFVTLVPTLISSLLLVLVAASGQGAARCRR